MTQYWNVVIENWYWFALGLLLLPAFCQQMLFSVVFGAVIGFEGDKYSETPYKYGIFFKESVRQGGGYATGWKRIFENKFNRLINLVTLYWMWGYVLLLLAYAAGIIVRWIWQGLSWFFGGLWRLISAVYNAI